MSHLTSASLHLTLRSAAATHVRPGMPARWRAWWQVAFGAPAAQPDGDDRFGTALQALAEGRWEQAFEQLAALADGGHPEAMRLALVMVRHGQRLGGWHCPLSPQRRARWAALAWSARAPGDSSGGGNAASAGATAG